MAEPTEAEKKAARDAAKAVVKEAISEWQAEETTRRTEEEKKNPPKGRGGLFDSLFGGVG